MNELSICETIVRLLQARVEEIADEFHANQEHFGAAVNELSYPLTDSDISTLHNLEVRRHELMAMRDDLEFLKDAMRYANCQLSDDEQLNLHQALAIVNVRMAAMKQCRNRYSGPRGMINLSDIIDDDSSYRGVAASLTFLESLKVEIKHTVSDSLITIS